jgi:transposase
MTLSDQAAITGHDGQVTGGQPARPKRRTFTAAYKARILAAFDALPEGSPERGELLRRERLYHSHIEHWRGQQEKARSPAPRESRGGTRNRKNWPGCVRRTRS